MGEVYRADGYLIDPEEKVAWKMEGDLAIDGEKPLPLSLMTGEHAFFVSDEADEASGVAMFELNRQGLPTRLLSDNFLASNEYASACQSAAEGACKVAYSDVRARACIESSAPGPDVGPLSIPHGAPSAELYESDLGLDLFYLLEDGTPAWWRRYSDRPDEAAADYSAIVCSGSDPRSEGWPAERGADASQAFGREDGTLIARGTHASFDASFESLGIATGGLGGPGAAFVDCFFPYQGPGDAVARESCPPLAPLRDAAAASCRSVPAPDERRTRSI